MVEVAADMHIACKAILSVSEHKNCCEKQRRNSKCGDTEMVVC